LRRFLDRFTTSLLGPVNPMYAEDDVPAIAELPPL
jgi:hypothetical protein